MASRQEHVAQAVRNRVVADVLANSGFHDWAMTALFYSAVHLVLAYVVQSGGTVTSHGERRSFIHGNPELRSILSAYNELKILSENARYDCHLYSQPEFEETTEAYYRPVESHMRALIT
jgi:hypothetical protein